MRLFPLTYLAYIVWRFHFEFSTQTFLQQCRLQYGLQIVKYIFPLITLPYLTRVLLPEGYAIYAYVVSFMTFAQTFVDFGFNLSGTKCIAKSETVEEENRAIGAVTEARLLLGVVTGAVVVVVALVYSPYSFEHAIYHVCICCCIR